MIDLDHIGVPAFSIEVLPDGRFRYVGVNAACQRRTGLSDEAIRGKTPEECQEPSLAARVKKRYAECVERGQVVEYDIYAQLPAGLIEWRTWLLPISDATGRVTGLLGIWNELSAHRQHVDLRATNRQLSMALQALKGASWTYDVENCRFTASDAFALLMGEDTARPVSWAEWCARVLPEDLASTFCDRLLTGQLESEMVEFRFRRAAGEVRWARCRRLGIQEESCLVTLCGVIVDVTEERLREESLIEQASRDALTGLLNRRGFKREAEKMILSRAENGGVAIFMVDLDHFKITNDTFGHPAGDAVLAEVSRRFPSVLGREAVCARLGGDEFVVLRVVPSVKAAADLRADLVDAMTWPFAYEGRRLSMSASVGMAVTTDRIDLASLMGRADADLYDDKHSRRHEAVTSARESRTSRLA